MADWAVDVWFSNTFPVGPTPDGVTSSWVEAPDGDTAELVACQMTASHPGRTPVGSCVIIGAESDAD